MTDENKHVRAARVHVEMQSRMGGPTFVGDTMRGLLEEIERLQGVAQVNREAREYLMHDCDRLRYALTSIDALDPEESISVVTERGAKSLVSRMGEIAREALGSPQ